MKKIIYILTLISVIVSVFTACDLFGIGDDCDWNAGERVTVSFYDCAGESPEKLGQIQIRKGNKLFANSKEVPAKKGYSGTWYKNSSCSEEYAFGQEINYNIDLYTKFVANQYTVSFDKNADITVIGIPAKMTCDYGTEYPIVFTTTLNYPKHELIEWNTDKNGNGTSVGKDGPVKNLVEGGEVTLYAQWKYDGFVVTYMDKETGNILKKDEVGEDKKTTATGYTPMDKKGYKLTGWVDSNDSSFNFSQDITTDTTLYAHWEPITYTIVFDKNKPDDAEYLQGPTDEGTVWNRKYSNIDKAYDEQVTLPNISNDTLSTYQNFYKEPDSAYKYKLIGWSSFGNSVTADYGSDEVINVSELVELTTPGDFAENKITLFAVWESERPRPTTGLTQRIRLIINHGSSEVKAVDPAFPNTEIESFEISYNEDNLVDNGYANRLDALYCVNATGNKEDYYLDGFYIEPNCTTKVLNADLEIDFDRSKSTKGYVGLKDGNKKVWLKYTSDGSPIELYAKWVKE